jgi:hypothetical protein
MIASPPRLEHFVLARSQHREAPAQNAYVSSRFPPTAEVIDLTLESDNNNDDEVIGLSSIPPIEGLTTMHQSPQTMEETTQVLSPAEAIRRSPNTPEIVQIISEPTAAIVPSHRRVYQECSYVSSGILIIPHDSTSITPSISSTDKDGQSAVKSLAKFRTLCQAEMQHATNTEAQDVMSRELQYEESTITHTDKSSFFHSSWVEDADELRIRLSKESYDRSRRLLTGGDGLFSVSMRGSVDWISCEKPRFVVCFSANVSRD